MKLDELWSQTVIPQNKSTEIWSCRGIEENSPPQKLKNFSAKPKMPLMVKVVIIAIFETDTNIGSIPIGLVSLISPSDNGSETEANPVLILQFKQLQESSTWYFKGEAIRTPLDVGKISE